MDGRDRRPRRALAGDAHRALAFAALAGLLLAGLLLVALRMNIVRTRYALADAANTETELLARDRELSVMVRRLRDPRRLRRLATERGFARPERVIELDTETATTRDLTPPDFGDGDARTRSAP